MNIGSFTIATQRWADYDRDRLTGLLTTGDVERAVGQTGLVDRLSSELLGFAADKRVLIVNCDDFGTRAVARRAGKCLEMRVLRSRALKDLRPTWPVIPFRGLAARSGPLRRFQADSRAGSAPDEKKPAVVMSNTSTDLQVFYGSDGTRTRDLRRDRPAF